MGKKGPLVIAACAAAVGVGASSALAGEVKCPPGVPCDKSIVGDCIHNTDTTGALDHAASACAASGLNDMDPNDPVGQTASQVQTAADSWKCPRASEGRPRHARTLQGWWTRGGKTGCWPWHEPGSTNGRNCRPCARMGTSPPESCLITEERRGPQPVWNSHSRGLRAVWCHTFDKLEVTGSSPVAPITATPGNTPYSRTERGPEKGPHSLAGMVRNGLGTVTARVCRRL